MALLSCYSSNWPPFHEQLAEYYSSSSESSSLFDQFIITQHETELSPDFNQLQAFPDDLFYSSSEYYPTNYNYNINSLLGDDLMTSNDNVIDIEPFNYPKLLGEEGSDYEQIFSHDNQYFIDEGLVQNPNSLTDLLPASETFFISPETILPAADHCPPSYSYGTTSYCGSLPEKETTAADRGLSAQSIAARQRRRKIAERTHELGKLVPGGPKMNTAEMLQAAYKYIKFLQAQLGILQFLDSYHQENYKNGEPSSESDEELDLMQQLHVLLESPVIQEKLYSTGKCLIPTKFAQEINHNMIK